MALWPATKILMNANLGQLKPALKISGLANSSTAGSVYESIYFSFLQHSATSLASPAVAAICPLFSHSPTLQLFWASVKSQTFHSHHPLWGFSSPVHQSCWLPTQETTTWNSNTLPGAYLGLPTKFQGQPDCSLDENSLSIHLSEGPVVSLSCVLPVKLCPWGSLSTWDVSTPCCSNGKGRGGGLQMRYQPIWSPTRYNHSLHAATGPEAAGAVPPFFSPHAVPGMWSLTLWASQKLWAQGTQKQAKRQKAYQDNQDVHSYSYCTARGQPQHEGNPKWFIHFRGGLQS